MKWPTPATIHRSVPDANCASSLSGGGGPETPSLPPCRTIVGTVIGRPGGEALLDRFEARIAGGVAVTVPVGVDHDRHEVGIVERRRRELVAGIVEAPARRPLLPQQAADLAPVLLQPQAPALGVEVPLVPVATLVQRGGRARGRHRVLDVVAADGHQRPHALGRPGSPRCTRLGRPSRSRRGRRACTPSASMKSMRSSPIAACCAIRGVAASRKCVGP